MRTHDWNQRESEESSHTVQEQEPGLYSQAVSESIPR